MKQFQQEDWAIRNDRFWVNFFNTLSGVRSSVLIGTSDKNGHHNLGIFNSLVHLGATPPLLGFILRPTTVKRDTYDNLKETGLYTINHIPENLVDQSHQTSAKYDAETSEFDAVGLTPECTNDKIPFVKESPVKMKLQFKEEHDIMNGTKLIVGEVIEVLLNESIIEEDGSLKLAEEKLIATSGLYHYHTVNFIMKKHYARP